MTEVVKWKRRADSSSKLDIPPQTASPPCAEAEVICRLTSPPGLTCCQGFIFQETFARPRTGSGNAWTLVLSRWILQLWWHWCSQPCSQDTSGKHKPHLQRYFALGWEKLSSSSIFAQEMTMNKWLPATRYFVRSLPPCLMTWGMKTTWFLQVCTQYCHFLTALIPAAHPCTPSSPAVALSLPQEQPQAVSLTGRAQGMGTAQPGSPGKDIQHHPAALVSQSYCFDVTNSSSPFPSLAQSCPLPQRQRVKVVASPLNCTCSARRPQCTSDNSLMQYIFQDRLLFSFLAAHPLSVVSFAHFSCKLSRGREKAFSFKQFPFQFPFIEFQPPFFFFKA